MRANIYLNNIIVSFSFQIDKLLNRWFFSVVSVFIDAQRENRPNQNIRESPFKAPAVSDWIAPIEVVDLRLHNYHKLRHQRALSKFVFAFSIIVVTVRKCLIVDRLDFRCVTVTNGEALWKHITFEWIIKLVWEAFFEQMSHYTEIIDNEANEDERTAISNQKLDEQTISRKHSRARGTLRTHYTLNLLINRK